MNEAGERNKKPVHETPFAGILCWQSQKLNVCN